MRPGGCPRAYLSRHLCCFVLASRALMASIAPAAAQSASTPILNPANSHWYQLVRAPSQINWPEARTAAQALFFAGYQGHLATITSADERQFVNTNVTGKSGLEAVWLGGFQDSKAPDYREPDGGWRWVTGEPFQFTNWHAGEPNDSPHDSNALQLTVIWGGEWDDRLATEARLPGYVVEYEPPAIPGAPRLGILPNPVIGGQSTVGLISLQGPAPSGDLVVSVASILPAAAVAPAVVIVPAGTTSATFSIVTFPVATPTSVLLTATGPGGSRTATLQILPPGAGIPSGNLLVNGSFEQPPVPAGSVQLNLRGNDLPGWRITRGSVDVAAAASWPAAPGEGSQSLDLVGETAGTIEETLPTVAGREYVFSGWVAHHPALSSPPEARANVSLNGQLFVQLFHRDAQASAADLRWSRFAYHFRATAATTTLALADATNAAYPGGLILDGLSVTPVQPNLLVNGSFEEPDLSTSGQSSLAAGPGALPGWRIATGTVDVVHRRSWQPALGQGNQSLHLLGRPGAVGAIEQSFPTEPGRDYTFSGWLAHHPSIAEGRANIYLNGDLLTQLFHSNALYGIPAPADLRWQPFLYSFRAVGPTTTLQIVDVTGISAVEGAALDGLAIAPAEEPAAGQVPVTPTGLTVRLISPTQIDLSWSDNSPDETGFEIQRRTGSGEWTRLALVGPNLTRFSDFSVLPGTSYSYRVRAVNDMGASAWSNEATGTTLAGP
jgi:hypothetical protein